MKAILIILNWLLSLLLLSYNGDSLILAFSVLAYFAISSTLLLRNKRQVNIAVRKMEKILSKITDFKRIRQ